MLAWSASTTRSDLYWLEKSEANAQADDGKDDECVGALPDEQRDQRCAREQDEQWVAQLAHKHRKRD